MKGLFKELFYVHALFAILLYLAGNFFTVVMLEYRLKNLNLKHTLASFASVALSGLCAYFIPIYLLRGYSLFVMQIAAVCSALVMQLLFWWLWFKDELKRFAPSLLIAFTLTVIGALIMYNLFVWYVQIVTKGAVKGAVRGLLENAFN